MTSGIWVIMMVGGMGIGAINGRLEQVSMALTQGAKESVALCGSLLGAHCLFMGLMYIAEKSGFATAAAKLCKWPLDKLFPTLKGNTEAMGSIAMNISANILGMGNAATPFGLQAMAQLQKHNRTPKTATHDMCMFLLLNTASVQLLPLTVISLRAAAGAAQPWDIVPGSFLVTVISAGFAVAGGKLAAGKR